MRAGSRLLAPGANVQHGRTVVGGGFVGVLDGISDVAAAYSLRKLRSAYTGDAVRVRRSSDDAEQDVGFDGSGDFDTSEFSAFVGGGTGYIVTWYDQSGNARNATQATASDQPQLILSGIGSLPTVSKTATNQRLATSSFGTLSQPNTVILVGQVPTGGGVTSKIFFDGISSGNRHQIWYQFTTDRWAIYSGSTKTGALWDSSSHIYTGIFYNTAGRLWLDGGTPDYSGTTGSQTLTGLTLFSDHSGSGNQTVNIGDIILVNASISTADHNTIGSNMATYYGLSWTTVT